MSRKQTQFARTKPPFTAFKIVMLEGIEVVFIVIRIVAQVTIVSDQLV